MEILLKLLKNAKFIIGNSSAGVREAPQFSVAAANLGARQHIRVQCNLVLIANFSKTRIGVAIENVLKKRILDI